MADPRLAREAEALGRHLPSLRVAAERVAATVAQGLHGRRRVGTGEAFWQFRPFVAGDQRARIDWRRSARSDRAFVRETELETAQTVCLWRDGGPAMQWHSTPALDDKRTRAELLLLALAALLARGGERMRLIAPGATAVSGPRAVDRLARALEGDPGERVPPAVVLPRHSRMLLFGDFLDPVDDVTAMIGRLAATPARGHLVQVLDPAEEALPFEGRVRFTGVGPLRAEALVPRVGTVRAEYRARLAAQQAAIAGACAAAGWTFAIHRTDHAPAPVLLALYQAMTA